MMIAAVAVSLTTVGTVLTVAAIVGREMPRNYLATHPASATLETSGGVTPDLVAAVRARPGVADVTARTTVMARVRIGDRWRPMLLFVADPADPMTMATFTVERGAWPPPDDTVLLERSGFDMLGVGVGDAISVRIGAGPPRSLTVSGSVHDAGVAPSWQEQTAYGYVTPAAITALGGNPTFDELRVVVSPGGDDATRIAATAQDLASWLATQGHPVSEIRLPPPNQHPHQWQLTVVLLMLGTFGVAAVLLAAVLVAAIVSAMLAEQVRQIGILKAVGARTSQIAAMYTLLPALVGALAAVVAFVPTALLGRGLSAVIAELLNLDLIDQSIPLYVFGLELAAGIILPVVVSLVPIVRASRVTVRQAIDDYGTGPQGGRVAGLDRRLAGIRGLSRPTLLSLRNTVRRPGRSLLTVAMLAFGGAVFLTGVNTIEAWNSTIDRGLGYRHYDLELRLPQPSSSALIVSTIGAVPGVASVEAWASAPTAAARPGEVDVVRVYPDKGHGSFTLVGLPPDTHLIDFPVLEGRWLRPGDGDAIVLNQTAKAAFPDVRVGDRLALRTADHVTTWRVVGFAQELGSPAMAYVSDTAYATAVSRAGMASLVRIGIAPGQSRTAVLDRVENAASAASIPVAVSLTTSELRDAIDQHVIVLMAVLVMTALLIATVGTLGLATTMSINVLERTREIGIMHALGALPRTVLRMIAVEGLTVGIVSVPLAFVLSLPLTAIVGSIIGAMSLRVPLTFAVSPIGVLAWLLLILLGSGVASAVPARNASRLSVREALAYA